MRPLATLLSLAALAGAPLLGVSAAHASTAQSRNCASEAAKGGLKGAARTRFLRSCQKAPLTPSTHTTPTGSSKEAQAITKPSGVDRTTRSAQCATEADKRGLSAKARKEFSLSCLATAGPVSEGETGMSSAHPAHQIKGIGENNYKPSASTAKSQPAPQR